MPFLLLLCKAQGKMELFQNNLYQRREREIDSYPDEINCETSLHYPKLSNTNISDIVKQGDLAIFLQTIYYDDDEYEDNLNIWASRVWTSSSENDNDSFLHALENGHENFSGEAAIRQTEAINEHACGRESLWEESCSPGQRRDNDKVILPIESPIKLRIDVFGTSRSNAYFNVELAPVVNTMAWTSPILVDQAIKNRPLLWNEKLFLLPHESIRRALQKAIRIVTIKNIPATQAWKIPRFLQWFNHLGTLIRMQYNIKRNVLLPMLHTFSIDTSPESVLDMAVSYDACFALLDAIQYFHRNGVSNYNKNSDKWHKYITQFGKYLQKLNDVVCTSLNKDERSLCIALGNTFSHQSYNLVVGNKVENSLPYRVKRIVVPWMLESLREWGGVGASEELLEGYSFVTRFLSNHFWRPYYKSHVASILVDIEYSDFHVK